MRYLRGHLLKTRREASAADHIAAAIDLNAPRLRLLSHAAIEIEDETPDDLRERIYLLSAPCLEAIELLEELMFPSPLNSVATHHVSLAGLLTLTSGARLEVEVDARAEQTLEEAIRSLAEVMVEDIEADEVI